MRFFFSLTTLGFLAAAVQATLTELHLDHIDADHFVITKDGHFKTTQDMLQHYGKPPCAADEDMFEISGIPGKVCVEVSTRDLLRFVYFVGVFYFSFDVPF